MKLPLSVIAEALGGSAGFSAEQIFEDIEILKDDICEPKIANVQLCTADITSVQFDENTLYLCDAQYCSMFNTRAHPEHALVICAPGQHMEHRAWHDVAKSLAVCTTAAPAVQVLNLVTRCICEFGAWDLALTDAMLQSRAIDEVLDIAARMLANPIAFFDTGSALVAQSGELPTGYEETIWGRVISEGASPMDYYTRAEQRELTKRLETEALPVVLAPQRTPQRANLAALIRARGHVCGTIGQVDICAPFTSGQIALANHVRMRLQQLFEQTGELADTDDELASVVGRMLDGQSVDRSILMFHLRKRVWDIADSYRITVCPFPGGTDNKVSNTTRMRNLAACFGECLVLAHDGAAVIVERAQGNKRKSALSLAKFKSTLSSLDMVAGTSVWFVGLASAAIYYRQALICLAEAERAGLEGALRYQDVFESHIAHLISSNVPVESICHPGVLALMRSGYRGDIEQGREFVEQLYTYLASGRNLHRCARLLYVHHNTLAYRIVRLKELLGIDFSQLAPNEIVHLELSCLLALNT